MNLSTPRGPAPVAGAAQVDITPLLDTLMAGGFERRRAVDVHDPLFARAIVLGDGRSHVAFLQLDVIDVMKEDVQRIRAEVERRVGIPAHHVLIAATHTHSGPAVRIGHGLERDEAYCAWMCARAADVVSMAYRRLQPARIAWGRGRLEGVSFCRRYRVRDGTVRMNPRAEEIVAPTASPDPEVSVLYAQSQGGVPLASLASFAIHYVGTDDPCAISADYFGHYARWMQRFFGEGFVPLLVNGAAGQINNRDPFEVDPDRGHARGRRIAAALAGEVIKTIHVSRPRPEATVEGLVASVEVPRKEITPMDIETARAILRGEEPPAGPAPFSWVVGQPIPRSMWRAYALECLRMAELPQAALSEVQALRVGDSAWVGLPGDAFAEIGAAIKAASPAAVTGIISHANDNLGYIPTDKALREEGGYETWGGPTFFTGPGSAGAIVEAARELLERLFVKA